MSAGKVTHRPHVTGTLEGAEGLLAPRGHEGREGLWGRRDPHALRLEGGFVLVVAIPCHETSGHHWHSWVGGEV